MRTKANVNTGLCFYVQVYMLGIAFWHLFFGDKRPFPHIHSSTELQELFAFLVETNPSASVPLHFPDGASPFIKELLQAMCALDAEKRPTAQEVCDSLAEFVPTFVRGLASDQPSMLGDRSVLKESGRGDVVRWLRKFFHILEYSRIIYLIG